MPRARTPEPTILVEMTLAEAETVRAAIDDTAGEMEYDGSRAATGPSRRLRSVEAKIMKLAAHAGRRSPADPAILVRNITTHDEEFQCLRRAAASLADAVERYLGPRVDQELRYYYESGRSHGRNTERGMILQMEDCRREVERIIGPRESFRSSYNPLDLEEMG